MLVSNCVRCGKKKIKVYEKWRKSLNNCFNKILKMNKIVRKKNQECMIQYSLINLHPDEYG